MARQSHLHLISKLRCDAGLFLPYTGICIKLSVYSFREYGGFVVVV